MEIRPTKDEDLNSILDIFNYSIIHTTTVYSYEPWTRSQMEDWFAEKANNDYPVLSAVINDQVIGYCSYGAFRQRPAYKSTVEHSVYIHKKYWGQGIAQALMDQLIIVAKVKNVHTMIGGVDVENKASIRFHLKMGFLEVAHISQVAYKFDRWLDLKFFQKML